MKQIVHARFKSVTLWVVLLLASHTMSFAQGRGGDLEPLSAAETTAILRHGPWPVPWRPDPSNGVSGNAEAVLLGRQLFFDARMSPSGRVACSSCHRPERGWTDGRQRGKGLGVSQRNTPSLYDVRLNRRFGWTGAGDSLWVQSIRPLLDPIEMGSSAEHVRAHIAGNADLAARYEAVFGRGLPVSEIDARTVLGDVGKALAAFQEAIVSGRAGCDAWRDALEAGDAVAAARYSIEARRGAVLFVGAAGCSSCHGGPAFSEATGPEAIGQSTDVRRGAGLRTPTLRNLGRTGPYLHDGSGPTLAAAIHAHRPAPRLTMVQVGELVAFLRTLSP